MDTCTYLDPRVKSLPYLSDTERQIIHDSAYDLCVKDATAKQSVQPNSPVKSPAPPITSKNSSGLGSLLKGMYGESSMQQCQSSINCDIADEMKRYNRTSCLDMEADPLEW